VIPYGMWVRSGDGRLACKLLYPSFPYGMWVRSGDGRLACKLLYPSLLFFTFLQQVCHVGLSKEKTRSHCVCCRTSTHARGHMAPYIDVCPCMVACTVHRRRTLQVLNCMLLTFIINGHNCTAVWRRTATQRNMPHELDLCGMLRPSPYGDAVCVNAAIEINVLDYKVAVRRILSVNGV